MPKDSSRIGGVMEMSINPLDIGIIIVIALASLRGLWNGFLPEAGGIVGLLAGLQLASRFQWDAANLLNRFEPISRWSPEIAFALLFLAGIIVVHLFISLLKPLIGKAVPGGVNRLAGLLLGALKGVLFCSVATALLKWVVPQWPLLEGSRLLVWLTPLFAWVRSMLPW